eukprot:Rhum_TRINITY_DN9858_c1_g1::Rhum_TRINITY_DN9858_c1_g1_i1::g.35683::m.35683
MPSPSLPRRLCRDRFSLHCRLICSRRWRRISFRIPAYPRSPFTPGQLLSLGVPQRAVIFWICASSSFPLNMASPRNISPNRHPMLHTSIFSSYLCASSRISRGRYHSVTIRGDTSSPLVKALESPKSQILTTPPCEMRMFDDFKSRCRMPCRCSTSMPVRIWKVSDMMLRVGKRWPDRRMPARSWSTYSKASHTVLCPSWCASSMRISVMRARFTWLAFFAIVISRTVVSGKPCWYRSIFICFRAHSSRVSLFRMQNTRPYVPSPICATSSYRARTSWYVPLGGGGNQYFSRMRSRPHMRSWPLPPPPPPPPP